MSTSSKRYRAVSKLGTAIGTGLLAGFVGTVAITISQMIEMAITKRQQSPAPVVIGGKVLGVEPRGEKEVAETKDDPPLTVQKTVAENKVEKNKEKFSQYMHFGYGTGWGVFRGLTDLAGIKGLAADGLLFTAVWGTEQVMLPANDLAKPISQQPVKQIAIDVLHHAVYAAAAGAVYRTLRHA